MLTQDLLRALMVSSGDNPNSLAAKLKNRPRQPQIYKFLEGIAKEPRRSTLEPVAEHYGISVEAFYDEAYAATLLGRLQRGEPLQPAHSSANVKFSTTPEDRTEFLAVDRAPPSINLTNNLDYPPIRRVRFKLSAGASGFAVEYLDGEEDPIVFKRQWYEKRGFKPEKLFATKVANGSMETGLYDGDTVVVNTEQAAPKDGIVFAVNFEGEMVVKRLVRDGGQWWLSSDNPDKRKYPRKVCDENVFLIGEIVHKQSERI